MDGLSTTLDPNTHEIIQLSLNIGMDRLDPAGASLPGIDLKYWFMLPVAIGVSTLAISAGIGGAALFAPILLIVFPLLGPEYPLQSTGASIATAILVETFGFSSGCIGYYRRKLIDPELSLQFALLSVPVAVLSAANLHFDALTLKRIYSGLMIVLSVYFFAGGDEASITKEVSVSKDAIDCEVEDLPECKMWEDSSGQLYKYSTEGIVGPLGAAATVVGSVLTGCLGVGIGEVVLPQLLRQGVPLSISAASSTLTVTLTALTSAVVQITELVKEGGLSVIPWNLIQFMIPGVLIGGQIASRAQGRLSQEQVGRAIAILFGLIGCAFAILTIIQSQATAGS
jgi:uncharacterized membrane protein YfcA